VSLENANTASTPEASYRKGHDALSRQSHALFIKRHQHESSEVVKAGDTLGKMAKVHLGKSANVHEIYNYVNKIGQNNAIKNVNHIEPGETIYFPPVHHHKHGDEDSRLKKAQRPSEAPVTAKSEEPVTKNDGRTAVVQAGDPAAKTGPDGKPLVEQPVDANKKTGADSKSDATKDAPAASAPPSVLPSEQRDSTLTSIGKGMGEELTENPLGVLGSAGLGAAAVAASKFLPGPAKWVIPGIGEAAAMYEIYEHVGELAKSVQVESNPDAFTAAEKKESSDTMHEIGRGIVDLTAGVIGGGITGFASAALRNGGLSFAGLNLTKFGFGGGPLYERAALVPLNKVGVPIPEGRLALPGKQLLLAGPDKAAIAATPEKVIALPGPDKPLLLTGPDKVAPTAAPTSEKQLLLTGPAQAAEPTEAQKKLAWSVISEKMRGPNFAAPGDLTETSAAH
jgi:hypothetical protein